MTIEAPPVRLWSNRRYLLWLTSDTGKGLGTTLFSFAIPLVALFVTNDPAQAGIIGGVGMATRLVTTLIGGALADRHNRIAMMLVGALIATFVGAAFTALAFFESLTFLTLLLLEVALCVRAGLFEPASESALKQVVPDEAMGRAQAANQGRDAALQLAGGPLGGALLAAGAWVVGAVMTAAYAFAAATAWVLGRAERRDPGHPIPDESTTDAADPQPARGMLREIREGFRWLFSRPDLSSALVVITIVNLGLTSAVTSVIYALQQAGHSEITIGTLSAVIGVAMLAGALVAPLLVPRVKTGSLVLVGLTTITLGACIVSLVDSPIGIGIVFGGAVLPLPALNAALMGYFMVATPSRLLGRANSAAGVLGMGAMPFAPLIAGFGLAWAGRTSTLILCAVLCALAALLALFNRPLRSLPTESGWSAHARQFA
ncbi:MFS transporter [Microbacterium esteraromaticum]|uniref:MFS transporter n=1 Tax=Microbacterium esteraromaticum TaxID=57043 RepID=UPI002368E54A|nr:MFS transporter [Microbacterium esteraromaticum]WDH78954.1 MFS transporter [Microbacterium esteraromaticum]